MEMKNLHIRALIESRLVEIQKVPKKIAPKIWVYQMLHHTFLAAKISIV